MMLFAFTAANSFGQDYSFDVRTESYSNLQNSTSLNNGEIWDDPQYVIPVGFDFRYFSQTITEVSLSDFGLGAFLSASSGTIGTTAILIPYSMDIADRGLLTENSSNPKSLSNISYVLEGSKGNQILKIEWNNAGFFADMDSNQTSTDYVNLQVWLFEGSNAIEVHFGPKLISQPDLVFEGEPGSVVALVEEINMSTGDADGIYLLTGNPVNPTFRHFTEEDTVGGTLSGIIPENTVYRFSQKSLKLEDLTTSNASLLTYPNPATDELHVYVNDFEGSSGKLEIFDILGNEVYRGETTNHTINVSSFSQGVYTLVATINGDRLSRRIVVQ